MTQITFTLNGKDVTVPEGMTIWEAANGRGLVIPHLCHKPATGYRPDGNCRACMVEVEGERTLVASCIRPVAEGMVVKTDTDRAEKSRKLVVELLAADQPEKAHDASSHFWDMAALNGVSESRFPAIEQPRVPLLDDSHVAMRVNLDACIHCNLCVRACREVQVNDVIGMAGRGRDAKIVFDQDDPMGDSTCVACGECVQACPTGALMPATVLDDQQQGDSKDYDREVESVCPYCGVGCQLSFKIKDNKIKYVEGIDGPANENRLCVKGRFGFDYIDHPHRLTKPLIRRDDAPAKGLNVDPANLSTHFREATWDEALDAAAKGLSDLRAQKGTYVAGFGSAKCSNEEAYLFQKLIRQGFGHNNVDHCTRLCHASSVAALLENVGSGAVTATFNQIEHSDVAIVIGANPTENHPVAATYFKQFAKRGGKLIVMDPRGQGLKRHASHMLQFKPGADVSMLNAIMHVIVEEELYDQQYIEAFTENWPAMKAHLKGFPPEKMAAVCGIEAEVLRDVARTFAGAKAGMIFWGMGISQHIHGTDNSRCLISLALMTGQVGRPGAGLHPLRGQNNVQGASDAGLIPMFLPDYQSVTDDGVRSAFTEVWKSGDFSNQKGLTVVEIMHAIEAGDIRGMYILGENPAMSDPDVRARPGCAGQARSPRGAGHLPDRDGELCRRDPAGLGLGREIGHRDQHQPSGPDGPPGRPAPGRGEGGLVDRGRTGETPWARLVLFPPARGLCGDEDQHALARQHHVGAAGEDRRHLSLAQPRGSGPAHRLRRRLPAPRRTCALHAGERASARRGSGCGLSLRADHRAAARALAYRVDDAALQRAGYGRARSQLFDAPTHLAGNGHRAGRLRPAHHPARQRHGDGSRRPRGGRAERLPAVCLCRSRGEYPDQRGARPLWQDPRVQVLGAPGRKGETGRGGMMTGRVRPSLRGRPPARPASPMSKTLREDGRRRTPYPEAWRRSAPTATPRHSERRTDLSCPKMSLK